MKNNKNNYDELPYERFMRSGPTSLTNAELLALILRTGTESVSATALGQQILSVRSAGNTALSVLYDLRMDELTAIRGIGEVKDAGCPAIAMGQIINYLRTTQDTRFTDDDDYNHYYAGRNYVIDDDWASLKFPSFPMLNEMLDSIDAAYQRGEELTDELAAALVFACGTACTQVYTSEGSGTFYVDQAYEAYQRFGFTDCMLIREPDSIMYATLISNLQAGYPAHLAVENPAGTVGHNVVVDGYRESDGKFHINFGYGGSLDNWYDIPDPNFYYGMTKVEGIILNIVPNMGPLAVHESTAQQPLEVYPNPVSDVLYVKNLPCEALEYSIFNLVGQKVTAGSTSGTISVAGLEKGIYFLQVKGENFSEIVKFVVK